MVSRYEKDVLLCVLDMYKETPFLWKRTHRDYLNKNMRDKAFKDMLQLYITFDENATIKILKKKIENMRTNYAKEYKKVLASKFKGDTEYVPTVWYYNKLTFLNSETDTSHIISDFVNVKQLSSDEEFVSEESQLDTLETKRTSIKRMRSETPIPSTPEKIINSSERLFPIKKLEQWEVFGKYIGMQMKDLNDRQLAISQKIISDVIFYAKFNRLAEESYVVVTPSSEHRSLSTDTSFQ